VHEERGQALRVAKVQKKVLQQQSLKSGFRSAESVVADRAIANFFYANGLNFSAADATTGSYYREMVSAIESVPETYTPPASSKLAGKLLGDAHSKMADDVQQRDKQGELSEKFGVTYTSDGWDSCDNLPLINGAYILANDGGVYQRSVDTSGKTKNAEYCAALMIEDIYAIGCTKVTPPLQPPSALQSLLPLACLTCVWPHAGGHACDRYVCCHAEVLGDCDR
jgi:hypothetical protein